MCVCVHNNVIIVPIISPAWPSLSHKSGFCIQMDILLTKVAVRYKLTNANKQVDESGYSSVKLNVPETKFRVPYVLSQCVPTLSGMVMLFHVMPMTLHVN